MNAGDRVRFLRVFDLAPDEVYDRVGEVGTAREYTVTRKNDKIWSVWKVTFDDNTNIWIKEKDLEIVG